MKIIGRWIFLDNHSIENLDKLYEWSVDKELYEEMLKRIIEGNTHTISPKAE